MSTLRFRHIGFFLLMLWMTACSNDTSDVEAQIKRIKKESRQYSNPDWTMKMDSIILLNPNDPEPYYRKAVREYRRGDYINGLQNLEIAAQLNPGEYANYLGYVYMADLRDYDRAQEIFEMAATKGYKEDVIVAGTVYMRLGIVYYKKGLYQKAIKALDKDVAEFGEKNVYTYTFVYRGMAKAKLNDAEGAIADFDKAIELWDKCPEAYYHKAILLQELGKKQEACRMVQKALLNKNVLWTYFDQLYEWDLEQLFDQTCR